MILDLWLILNIAIGVTIGGLTLFLVAYAIVLYDDHKRDRLIDQDLAGDS